MYFIVAFFPLSVFVSRVRFYIFFLHHLLGGYQAIQTEGVSDAAEWLEGTVFRHTLKSHGFRIWQLYRLIFVLGEDWGFMVLWWKGVS